VVAGYVRVATLPSAVDASAVRGSAGGTAPGGGHDLLECGRLRSPRVTDPRVGALWCHRSELGIAVPCAGVPRRVLIGSPGTPAGRRTVMRQHSTTWPHLSQVPPLSTGRRARMLSSGEASKGSAGAGLLTASGITHGITPLSGALAAPVRGRPGFSRQRGGSHRPRAPS
jgi:hypothetical protein